MGGASRFRLKMGTRKKWKDTGNKNQRRRDVGQEDSKDIT